jgi:hypothetical protein
MAKVPLIVISASSQSGGFTIARFYRGRQRAGLFGRAPVLGYIADPRIRTPAARSTER